MKHYLQHLLNYSLILFTLSLALPTFGQQGPPPPRKETRGGTGQGNPCLVENGRDHTIEVCYFLDSLDFLDDCDLYAGYDLITSDMTYVELDNWTPNNPGFMSCFNIIFTSEDISEMCENDEGYYLLGLYCLENGVFQDAGGVPAENYPICLECAIPNASNDRISNQDNLPNGQSLDFELSDVPSKKYLNDCTSFQIYDLHGNNVGVFKNPSTNISLEQQLANTTLSTGIYIVRYLDGEKICTKKVFKY